MSNINSIKLNNLIENTLPIEDKLNVIIVVSNPCLYKRRYVLAQDFIERSKSNNLITLFIVELCYNDQQFVLTDSKNPHHLQLKSEYIMWHKENMINIGVKKLFPENWKAMAWIDADIEFENSTWALDALKILNGHKDIIQLWSSCKNMKSDQLKYDIYKSFGHEFNAGLTYLKNSNWHPGYAWACTKKAYEQMGGLFELGILGGGDTIISLSIIKKSIDLIKSKNYYKWEQLIYEFENKVNTLRLGYIEGIIKHHYHGSMINRQYCEKWKILLNHNYDPLIYITKNEDGLLIPTNAFPQELLNDIFTYFKQRNEDEE